MGKIGRIEVKKSTDNIASCNTCFARNYDADDKSAHSGRYTPDIYDVYFGNVCIYICRDCLRKLGELALDVANGDIR